MLSQITILRIEEMILETSTRKRLFEVRLKVLQQINNEDTKKGNQVCVIQGYLLCVIGSRL